MIIWLSGQTKSSPSARSPGTSRLAVERRKALSMARENLAAKSGFDI
jgi:hypothetical protein